MNPLDRPVWASLSTTQAHLSQGTAWARRYQPQVHLFAATAQETPDALAELASLLRPGESVFVLQVPELVLPPGLRWSQQAVGVQMVATRDLRAEADEADLTALADLGEADAADMLALAQLTQPGPFLARTHTMGGFLGRRQGGQLVAMAGERMRFPGHTEISGVCTHPMARGQGLARRLSAAVAARIQSRGEQAFLHAWQSNAAAIALYESLGFRIRTLVQVGVLERPPTP